MNILQEKTVGIGITNKESICISYLRCFATILIVTCHLLQGIENRWAWILNIGVQIFFFISGFLYGMKDVENMVVWIKKRCIKILAPYYIYIAFAFTAIYFLNPELITIKKVACYIFDLQAFRGGVRGLNHLWFLTIIAICYIITPLLQLIAKKHTIFSLLTVCTLLLVGAKIGTVNNLAIYSIAYFLAYKGYIYSKYTLGALLIINTIIMSMFSWEKILDYSSYYNISFHFWLGIFIGVISLTLFRKAKIHLTSAVKLLDKYSYEIYITHHIYILGYFSLIGFTSYLTVDICIILFLTLLSSVALHYISNSVTKIIKL